MMQLCGPNFRQLSALMMPHSTGSGLTLTVP